jgi:hypothetical protein
MAELNLRHTPAGPLGCCLQIIDRRLNCRSMISPAPRRFEREEPDEAKTGRCVREE